MSRIVCCKKLKQEAEGLDFQPYPGDLGKDIFDNISKKAWSLWVNQQTMLINEYRLNMLDQKSRDFLKNEMIKFLFEEVNSPPPPGYIPPEQNSLD
jgi:Fe-S cluster biosynthesis and repair protein YggX